MYSLLLILLFVFTTISGAQDSFPADFKWGVSTSAYQSEGAWNLDGKGESIWDYGIHKDPDLVLDKSNGDVAADSYHFYEKDVEALKYINVSFYRFSIAWSRILPNGDLSVINKKGIEYYDKLIDLLTKNHIQPMVTMYHWDLPQKLQDIGGWANPNIIANYEDYAKLIFKKFSNRVKYWITFNEPFMQCVKGYGGKEYLPLVNYPGVADYMCAHNLLQAHARVYHYYKAEIEKTNPGKIGMSNVCGNFIPKSDSKEDKEATETSFQFMIGWFMHPIVSKTGNYPAIMIKKVKEKSMKEGLSRSRLPYMNSQMIKYIKGTFDFVGVNYYSSQIISSAVGEGTSWESDQDIIRSINESWPYSSISDEFRMVPEGLRNVLNWIKKEYNNPDVFITENGTPDNGEMQDNFRIKFIGEHLKQLFKAVFEDGCHVLGYTVWSLIDEFEWFNGYKIPFGLFQVDFNSKDKGRKPKASADFFKEVASTNKIPSLDKFGSDKRKINKKQERTGAVVAKRQHKGTRRH